MREECPQRAAFLVTTGDRAIPITWRQFTDDIAVIVRIIQSYAPGGVIGLLGENSYEWMVAHAAVLFSGATVVPVDVNLDAADISRRLKSVDASALIYSALYGDKAREVGRLTPGLVVGGFGTRKTDLFLEAARAAMRFGVDSVWDVGAKTAETAMIMFTSGTTSEPRGAELALAGVGLYDVGLVKSAVGLSSCRTMAGLLGSLYPCIDLSSQSFVCKHSLKLSILLECHGLKFSGYRLYVDTRSDGSVFVEAGNGPYLLAEASGVVDLLVDGIQIYQMSGSALVVRPEQIRTVEVEVLIHVISLYACLHYKFRFAETESRAFSGAPRYGPEPSEIVHHVVFVSDFAYTL